MPKIEETTAPEPTPVKTASAGRGRGRGSNSRQHYQKSRVDKLREDRGAKTMAALQERLNADLYVGTHGENDTLAKLEQAQTLKSITLSITTRAIGFNLCHLVRLCVNYGERIAIPSIYELYRVYLGLIEVKVASVQLPMISTLSESLLPPPTNVSFVQTARSAVSVPEPISLMINAIGAIKYNDACYVPAIAAKRYTRNGLFIPRPENVVLSTLRETVIALANPLTPLRWRTEFRENCPIPGTIWENNLLVNGNEIMPEHYDLALNFQQELSRQNVFMTRVQKAVPKMVGSPLDFKSQGSKSLFISNEMNGMHTPYRELNEPLNMYYDRCFLHGTIHNYYALFNIEAAQRLEGELCLLGELPNHLELKYPVYHMRDQVTAPLVITANYGDTIRVKYSI